MPGLGGKCMGGPGEANTPVPCYLLQKAAHGLIQPFCIHCLLSPEVGEVSSATGAA